MKNEVNKIETFIPNTIELLREAVTFNKECSVGRPIPDATVNQAINELDKFVTRFNIYKFTSIVFGIVIIVMALTR